MEILSEQNQCEWRFLCFLFFFFRYLFYGMDFILENAVVIYLII